MFLVVSLLVSRLCFETNVFEAEHTVTEDVNLMFPKLLSAATSLSAISRDRASAEDGCGPGFHRNS
jgi:hypothetical protein